MIKNRIKIFAASALLAAMLPCGIVFADSSGPSINGSANGVAVVVDDGKTVLIENDGSAEISFSFTRENGDKVEIRNAVVDYSFTDDQILQVYEVLESNGYIEDVQKQKIWMDISESELADIVTKNMADIDESDLFDSAGHINKFDLRGLLEDSVKECIEQEFGVDGIVTITGSQMLNVKITPAEPEDADGEGIDSGFLKILLLASVGSAILGVVLLLGYVFGEEQATDGEKKLDSPNSYVFENGEFRPKDNINNVGSQPEPKAPAVVSANDVSYTDKLHEIESKIKDNKVKYQIKNLRRTAADIDKYLDENPDKVKIARRYKEFYRDTALEFISKYLICQEKHSERDGFEEMTSNAVRTLILFNRAFEEQYAKLCEDQFADFNLDSETLNRILEGELGRSIPEDLFNEEAEKE